MPRRYVMSEIVTRCQRRCDLVGDDHIDSSEWKALISEAYGELWSIVSEAGYRYFESKTTVTATGATSYTEPADHYSTLRIVRNDASGIEDPLDELMEQEEPYVKGRVGDARYWTLADDQLFLYPNPSSGTYTWYYLEQPTDLSSYADAAIVDVVSPAGEAFLVWNVAVKALSKSESDVRLAMAERDRYGEQLREWATLRAFESRRPFVREAIDVMGSDPADWRRR
jgi:hypothetical protein